MFPTLKEKLLPPSKPGKTIWVFPKIVVPPNHPI